MGLTEDQAVEQLHGEVDVYISRFKPMKNTLRWVVRLAWSCCQQRIKEDG